MDSPPRLLSNHIIIYCLQRRRGLSGFFPAGRALSLRSLEESGEDKMDDLKRDIAFLKQRQLQQVLYSYAYSNIDNSYMSITGSDDNDCNL